MIKNLNTKNTYYNDFIKEPKKMCQEKSGFLSGVHNNIQLIEIFNYKFIIFELLLNLFEYKYDKQILIKNFQICIK